MVNQLRHEPERLKAQPTSKAEAYVILQAESGHDLGPGNLRPVIGSWARGLGSCGGWPGPSGGRC